MGRCNLRIASHLTGDVIVALKYFADRWHAMNDKGTWYVIFPSDIFAFPGN